MEEYVIIYDFCDPADPNACEWHGLRKTFNGSWNELMEEIERMKLNGCYHIDAVCIKDASIY